MKVDAGADFARLLIRATKCPPPANRSGSMKPINLRIAEELGVREQQVATAISLLDGGATVAGFYERNGAVRSGEAPSDAVPGRLLPLYELWLTLRGPS
jgi:hypothetical protein